MSDPCPSWLPSNVWQPNAFGIDPCFVEFYLVSLLPFSFLLFFSFIALWCNRTSRLHYRSLQTEFLTHGLTFTTPITFPVPVFITICLKLCLHAAWTFWFLSISPGLLLSGIIKSLSWSLALFITVFLVRKPVQKKFRGFLSWKEILVYFTFADTICTTLGLLESPFYFHKSSELFLVATLFVSMLLLLLFYGIFFFKKERNLQSTTALGTCPPISHLKSSNENTASLFSLAFFNWFQEMINLGASKSIEMEDLWDLYPNDKFRAANENYQNFVTQTTPLIFGLWRTLKHHLLLQLLTGFLASILAFSGPFFLNRILIFLEENNPTWMYGLTLVLSLFIASLTKSLLDGQTYFRGRRIGTRVRAIIIGQVYSKTLRTQNSSLNTGHVLNLMQVDTNKIVELACYLQYFFTTPFQILVAIFALYQILGWSSFAGVFVMMLVVPLNAFTGKSATKLQSKLMEATDHRISVVSEIFNGIRAIKYFSWETKVLEWLTKVRTRELKALEHYLFFVANLSVLWYFVPLLVTMSSFSSHVFLMGQSLTPTKVFTTLSLFMALKAPLYILPDILIRFLEVRICFQRIHAFLSLNEVELIPETPHISIRGHFQWCLSPSHFLLNLVDVQFPSEKLTLIIGKTGSGKSTLLHTILGELHRLEGKVTAPNEIAYVSQQPWLQNLSVKENIVFGQSLDSIRYKEVLRVCAMEKDLQTFDGGDSMEVGDNGSNLSGGQKSRISLCRAVYSKSCTVLMDDVLSALDPPTANYVFHNCILGMMQKRTRILVTHSISLALPYADYIVIMDNGMVRAQGTIQTILNLGILDDLLAKENASNPSTLTSTLLSPLGNSGLSPSLDDSPETRNRTGSTFSTKSFLQKEGSTNSFEEHTLALSRTIPVEDRCRGSVSWHVYFSWIKSAGGIPFLVVLIILFIFQNALMVSQDFWLRQWSNAYTLASANEMVDVVFYLSVYIGLGVASILCISLRLYIQYRGSLSASRELSNQLDKSLLHAQVRFFDITPLGRILNRLSRDIQTLDRDLCRDVVDMMINGFQLLTIMLILTFISPYTLIFLAPSAFFFFWIGNYFLKTSRELKRLDSLTRSPIYSFFSETLAGVSTIRAFRQVPHFIQAIGAKVDENHRAFFYLWVSNRWLSVRTDLLGSSLVLMTGVTLLLSQPWIDAALAGLLLSYSLVVTESMMWFIRSQAMVEMDMNSVERLCEWIEHIEQEPQLKKHPVLYGWPNKGVIRFNHLTVQYSPTLPTVLKDLTFTVQSGEKVGICGRTGAGKSSLAASIFRFVPWVHGSIMIDQVDISTLDLNDLRSKLTMVPQNPMLFRGTVRSNLDVFHEYSDPELESVLQRVHLNIGLDDIVRENGCNFSVGARQIISLARALLRRTRILILDEATSNVDSETDALIQNTIRSEFQNCTILTIAHRLKTIIDFDKVLVLDNGEVVQFDTPKTLLSQTDGVFYKMCLETGELDTLISLMKN